MTLPTILIAATQARLTPALASAGAGRRQARVDALAKQVALYLGEHRADVQHSAAHKDGIVPLQSNALALRFSTLRPGPELAMCRPDEGSPAELLEPPSVIERRLRARLGEFVVAQADGDEAGSSGLRGGLSGAGLCHRSTRC